MLGGDDYSRVDFDDLQLRRIAGDDPGLFLSQRNPPLILDEVQYVPELFPELKRIVDQQKRQALKAGRRKKEQLFRLTGSNQILLDRNVKESLAGRASYFLLNTLSVSEISRAFSNPQLHSVVFKGGWPELYTEADLEPVHYLNDYIRTYIENDIVISAGISKLSEFTNFLALLAGRTAEVLNYTSLANDCGVRSVTIKEWLSHLEHAHLVYLLKPYSTNLHKRVVKAPKIHFLDTGLCARLQGWQESLPLINSPQAGHIFETLVCAEIVKYIQNHLKPWNLFYWRTKDGDEIDFILEAGKGRFIAFDARLGMQSLTAKRLPRSFHSVFPDVAELILVSAAGEEQLLSRECRQLPISKLATYLHNV